MKIEPKDENEEMQNVSIQVSKLKLLPIDERNRLVGLIEQNIGKSAFITLDHTDPRKILVTLHPEHARMVKVGWLQDVDMDVEQKELMGK
jgi:hypothetical protein